MVLPTISVLFNNPITVLFQKREKRFFSYFSGNNSESYTAHCINTGPMTGLLVKDSLSIITPKNSGKLLYTWQAIQGDNIWIGVNTWIPNEMVEMMLKNNILNKYGINGTLQRDKKMGDYKPDFSDENTIIEVKNVHWKIEDSFFFPDCVTERGTRQLKNMIQIKTTTNKNIIIIYIIQRHDGDKMTIAQFADKEYYNTVILAKKVGITILAFTCKIDMYGVHLYKQIDFYI